MVLRGLSILLEILFYFFFVCYYALVHHKDNRSLLGWK